MYEHTFADVATAALQESELRDAIRRSRSWAEVLRRLHYASAGGNWRTLQKYARRWTISTDHFDPDVARNEALARARVAKRPLTAIMVQGSSYSRAHLKERLFEEGLKRRICELCGQSELWRGRRMALILDHINGVADDHRLENLRVVCPNCAATLDTHCARKNRLAPMPRDCPGCGDAFFPRFRKQRYCSRACGQAASPTRGLPRPEARKTLRPPYLVLLAEIERNGYLATGRKYSVSDNAIRKWVRFYENEIERRSIEAPGEHRGRRTNEAA